MKQLPFQIQIQYTKLNGARCLRLISKTTQITDKREEAEKAVNVGVVGLHSNINAAKLAAEGNYTKARMVQKTNMRMVRRALQNPTATSQQQKQYSLWNQEAVRLNNAIKQEYQEETDAGLDYNSACDDQASDEESSKTIAIKEETDKAPKEEKEEKDKESKKKQKEDRKKERKVRRTKKDDFSNVLHQAQNPIYSAFTEDSNPLYSDD